MLYIYVRFLYCVIILEAYIMYKPAYVANAFLSQALDESIGDIDQLKIQKLVYCMHGWNLAINGEPLVGEMYEAWPYGPVLSSLYHEFKGSGSNPIDYYAYDINPLTGEEAALKIPLGDTGFYDVFTVVWNRYKGLNGLQLSSLTHSEGTPWSTARNNGNSYLSDDEIRTHFLGLAEKLNDC